MPAPDTVSSRPTELSAEFLSIFKKKGEALQKQQDKYDLGTLPARIKALRESLKATDAQVTAGLKEFSSFLHLDDIILSGGIKQSEKVKLLIGISDTLALIQAGRATVVKSARKLQDEIDKSGKPELVKEKIYDECLSTVNGWSSDVPNGIRDEAPLIKERVKALNGTPAEKAQVKQAAAQKIAGLKADVDNFKSVIASHSSRSFERTDPFATRMLTSLTPDEQKAIYPVWEQLALAGQQFLDASMSLDKLGEHGERGGQKETRYDFQELYDKIIATGLPQAWWPPRLVEQVQAWRKASRIHNAQNSKKPKAAWKEVGSDALDALGKVAKLGSFAGGLAAFDASFNPEALPDAPIEPEETAERFTMLVGAICSLTGGLKENVRGIVAGEAKEKLKEMLTFDETIDLSERLDQLLLLLGKSGDAATTVMDLVANVEKIKGTELGKVLDAKVVPGLGLAVHIFKLATAIKAAADSAMLTSKTKRLGVTSDQQDASGLRQDGGVTTKALDKAVKSQQEFTARKGLEVFVESTQVTAQAVILSGVSAGAGYGLSAVASGIELAGEMVFDGVDWSQAKVAKKLLEQARAGSPTAQQMLFENCELYAKLYLAILVREADPLGEKYVKDRGITQDSLDKPTSIWVLGEALRGAVQKEDDTEIDDNLAMHLAGPFGRLGKLAAGAVVVGVSAAVEKGRQIAASDYDPNWKPPAPVDLQSANWARNKDAAVAQAGLRNDTSGVGDGLKALEACTEEYDKIAAAVKGGDAAGQQSRLKQISKVLQQAGIARGLLSNFRPVQGKDPSLVHAPMVSVLEAMHSDFNRFVEEYKLRAAGIQGVSLSAAQDGKTAILDIAKTPWVSIKSDPACQTRWKPVWQSALDKVGLADDDHGVAKLLGTVQAQWGPLQEKESSSQIVDKKHGAELYNARKSALDAMKAAVDALGLCAKSVVLFPNLAAFVGGARDDVAAQMRAIDDRLCNAKDVRVSVGSKPALPAHSTKSSANDFAAWAGMWRESWTEASDLGYCSTKGGDALSKALHGFATSYAALLAVANVKDRSEKRDAALKEGAEVLKKCDELFRNEPYAPDAILALAKGYLADVMAGRARLIDEVSKAVVLDPADLKALQDAVPGKVPDGGKGLIVPNELQSGWVKAYQGCLRAGVATKSDSGGALGTQLGAVKAAMDEANKFLTTGKCAAGDLGKLYDAMDKVRKEITAAIKLVNKLLAAPGFAANDQIMDLLSVLGAEFGNYLAVIEDRRGKIELSGADMHEDEFSKVKNTFIKQRLAPAGDTGVSELIKNARKTTNPVDRAAHRNSLDIKVGELIKQVQKEMDDSNKAAKATKPPGEPVNYGPWIGYLRALKAQIP